MGAAFDFYHELATLRSSYPRFVTRGVTQLPAAEIPVFVFHSLEPAVFGPQLAFLKTNGYRAIALGEYAAILGQRARGTGKEVLITVDDARSSMWRYGLPLLKQYDCHATLFAIPGWTPDAPATPRLTLEDAQRGDCQRADLAALDPEDATLCSWSELRALQSSGLVDVESHTWLHRRVFAGARLTGFIGSDSRITPFNAAFSPYLDPLQHAPQRPASEYFGLPLFEYRAVLEGVPAWRLRVPIIEKCREAYAQMNPAPGDVTWRRALRNRFSELWSPSAFERGDEVTSRREIETEIGLARDALRENLRRADAGEILCIPFSLGSPTAVEIARHVGIRLCFGGVQPGRPVNRPGDDPLQLVRLKNDFLRRLPGQGRQSLASVYLDKVMRRMRGDAPY